MTDRGGSRRPPATRREPVVDEMHGESIVDHYRWLEGEGQEVRDWVDAQNRHTDRVLGPLPGREEFRQELARLLSGDTVGTAEIRGRRVFYTFRRSGQDQPVLYARDLGGGEEKLLVDPNRDSEHGTVSLDWWHPSPEGNLVAFGLSSDGDEWSTLEVARADTGQLLADRIPRARYASVAWDSDERGFHYTRYPHPGEVPAGEENYNRRVFYHRLGADPSGDTLVYGEGRPREEMYGVSRSDDGRHLLLTVNHGWNSADVYVRRHGEDRFTPVARGRDALFTGQIVGDRLYLLTNYMAPRYRIIAVDLYDPAEASWDEILPESGDITLQHMKVAGNRILVAGVRDATSRLLVVGTDGSGVYEVDLGTPGSAGALAGEPGNPVALFRYESFAVAPAIYRLDVATGDVRPWLSGQPVIDPDSVEVRQVFFRSGDGTRVPMFIIHRQGLRPGGATPTVLTGYGGFNISLTPTYSPIHYPWIRRGMILAQANLRGGSEYGEQWHRAGMLSRKQNVFDDFIAAAEHLVNEGYTGSGRLAISGGSNGGLLVGAAMTQRPDLFRAVVCGVPLLDMLRFDRFLIARLWVSEYGSPDDPEAFRWLREYSPYHRVVDGEEYPAVYLFTAESDTRVHPLHARKMTALLQHATGSDPLDRPVLLRVETAAGHGAGKPVRKRVEQHAEILTFLSWQLGGPG